MTQITKIEFIVDINAISTIQQTLDKALVKINEKQAEAETDSYYYGYVFDPRSESKNYVFSDDYVTFQSLDSNFVGAADMDATIGLDIGDETSNSNNSSENINSAGENIGTPNKVIKNIFDKTITYTSESDVKANYMQIIIYSEEGGFNLDASIYTETTTVIAGKAYITYIGEILNNESITQTFNFEKNADQIILNVWESAYNNPSNDIISMQLSDQIGINVDANNNLLNNETITTTINGVVEGDLILNTDKIDIYCGEGINGVAEIEDDNTFSFTFDIQTQTLLDMYNNNSDIIIIGYKSSNSHDFLKYSFKTLDVLNIKLYKMLFIDGMMYSILSDGKTVSKNIKVYGDKLAFWNGVEVQIYNASDMSHINSFTTQNEHYDILDDRVAIDGGNIFNISTGDSINNPAGTGAVFGFNETHISKGAKLYTKDGLEIADFTLDLPNYSDYNCYEEWVTNKNNEADAAGGYNFVVSCTSFLSKKDKHPSSSGGYCVNTCGLGSTDPECADISYQHKYECHIYDTTSDNSTLLTVGANITTSASSALSQTITINDILKLYNGGFIYINNGYIYNYTFVNNVKTFKYRFTYSDSKPVNVARNDLWVVSTDTDNNIRIHTSSSGELVKTISAIDSNSYDGIALYNDFMYVSVADASDILVFDLTQI